MTRRLKVLGLACLAALSFGVQAGTPATFANLTFSFTTTASGYANCTELKVDATGDFANSTKFVIYGALNCPAIAAGYTLAGSGYFGFDGSINMAFFIGNGNALRCPTLVNLAGTCTVHSAAGTQVGTATIALK